MKHWIRERIYGSELAQQVAENAGVKRFRYRPPRPKKPRWTPLTRGSVANLVGSGQKGCGNPAARAAYRWAAQVILESGDPDEKVLFPKDYL